GVDQVVAAHHARTRINAGRHVELIAAAAAAPGRYAVRGGFFDTGAAVALRRGGVHCGCPAAGIGAGPEVELGILGVEAAGVNAEVGGIGGDGHGGAELSALGLVVAAALQILRRADDDAFAAGVGEVGDAEETAHPGKPALAPLELVVEADGDVRGRLDA